MADTILREQTDQEKNLAKGGFKDLKNWKKKDIRQQANVVITSTFQKCVHTNRKPYCTKCALEAVEDRLAEIERKRKVSERKRGVAGLDLDIKIDLKIDWESFGNFNKFEFVGESEVKEDKLLDGMRNTVVTGKYYDYMCKECGSKISIQYSNEEIKKMESVKKA